MCVKRGRGSVCVRGEGERECVCEERGGGGCV